MKNIFPLVKKILIGASSVTLLAGAVFLVPSGLVQAAVSPQTGTPPTSPSTTPSAQQTARLENLYQRELKALAAQGTRLNNVDALVVKAQDAINRLKANGKNVVPLQTALDDFNATLPSAEAAHASAQMILDAHAGFDANGKVTNLNQARQTVLTAGQDLRAAHRILTNAVRDLRRVVRIYRHAAAGSNPAAPAGTPAATPTPDA
ncbi:MAG: hypothetical protein M1281_14335 [Chloroflexi bacterium]|nr:hypothetical protein [Chloroflexota bacterium]